MEERVKAFVDRHWLPLLFAAYALFFAYLIWSRWANIQNFALSDTDDNMRIAQVRAWLNNGQDWFDLRQYRLNAPDGANMHWSRLVDLPLAGLILLGRLFLGGPQAEMFAVAVAPILPLAVLMIALALTIRRLVHPSAWPLMVVCLFFAGSCVAQFVPTRIDHHGWQLAFLAIAVAGLADPRRARGGVTVGLASALSLAIGLELMIYLALAGVAQVLMWVADAGQRRRLGAYAASLSGGTALAFLLFASNDNRLAVCDALSPVWLSDALVGGALMLALAWWSPASWKTRLVVAVAAGAIIAGFHALVWPHCLSRLEGVSDEVYQLWLSHVREARPFYRHPWKTAATIIALPATGLIGWAVLAWFRRRDPRLPQVLAAGAIALTATALLFWQSRTGPAAQMMAIPGAVALAVLVGPRLYNSRHMLVRTLGTTLLVLLALGGLVPLLLDQFAPNPPRTERQLAVARANASCPTLAAMRPIAKLPPATMFTFGDLAPRLIAITPHRAIIGPYHRNGPQIVDAMKFFRGTPDEARVLADKYRADYVLICPMMSQATVYMAEAPRGFYVQLASGRIPAWLDPVPLPEGSPLKLWRVKRP
ncbi:AcrB/AcrD/AcrF family protein [Sphingomonas mesophila]|uniref:AcrB/AcrD/AcrF family protein n=1 Tax=Sphingomonas mesophila TaxID=2303576 RepID=UPI000E569C3F|nr:AcrB/AcrD/AcrF family protein [Sphingomonas mesophila]